MKRLTKNNLIIIATICFAISAICSSATLDNSIESLEPIQKKIWYQSTQNEERNHIDTLRALMEIYPEIISIVDQKEKSYHSHLPSFNNDLNGFNIKIEKLSKNITIFNTVSLTTFLFGLAFSALAIWKKEKDSFKNRV